MEPGWCWRAADARNAGLPAPADPRECYAPCPPTTRRVAEILNLVQMGRTQLRVGVSGVYGLDWPVLLRMADDLGITTDAAFYEMLGVAEGELVLALTPPKKPGEGEPEG